MARVIKVGVFFVFYPDGEHRELFEDLTEDEVLRECQDLAYRDISQIVFDGRLGLNLNTEIVKDGE
jgi:hypothetical protein